MPSWPVRIPLLRRAARPTPDVGRYALFTYGLYHAAMGAGAWLLDKVNAEPEAVVDAAALEELVLEDADL